MNEPKQKNSSKVKIIERFWNGDIFCLKGDKGSKVVIPVKIVYCDRVETLVNNSHMLSKQKYSIKNDFRN